MTPPVVKFTGLDFDPALLRKEFMGAAPAKWLRHQFKIEGIYTDNANAYDLKEWMHNNMAGRWSLQAASILSGTLILLAFEKDTDAVMFRLMDGETAWREDTDELH
jgi:hypothetical protein